MKFNYWFQMGNNVCCKNSHKECKDFKIRVYHTKMLCWNLANGPKFRRSFLKNMAGTKVGQLLGDYVYIILDKIEVICFKLQGNGAGNGSFNIKDTSTERFQLQMAFLHQNLCITKAGLSSLRRV